MQYIKQILIILAFTALGELLAWLIPLPIPAAIYGLVLLLIALCSGLLKPEKIADTARFFLSIMPFLFVAPAVNILKYWGIIQNNLVAIAVIVVVSTLLVFTVGGLVSKLFLKGGEQDD